MLNLCFISESMFYTQSVMLNPCFIPESMFYTQSIMLSPRFMPQSVFYTQSTVCSPKLAIFYTDQGPTIILQVSMCQFIRSRIILDLVN